MAGRQMVGQRKPSGQPANPEGGGSPGAHAKDFADSQGMGGAPPTKADAQSDDDSDVVKCPNCACEFNEETLDVVKPGKPVEGGSDGPEGIDLETPQHPVPGRMGAAHDAAVGDSVMSSLLAGLKGSMGGAR